MIHEKNIYNEPYEPTILVTNPIYLPDIKQLLITRDGSIDVEFLDLLNKCERQEALHNVGKAVIQAVRSVGRNVGQVMLSSLDRNVTA